MSEAFIINLTPLNKVNIDIIWLNAKPRRRVTVAICFSSIYIYHTAG